MLKKCSICGVYIHLFGEKHFAPIGKGLGSCEITDNCPICNKCHLERFDDENDVEAINRITQLMQEGKFSDALTQLKLIYKAKNPGHNYNAANIFMNFKQFDKALKYYDRALFLNTHHIKAWYRKGTLFTFQNNLKSAVKCFENVSYLDPYDRSEWNFPAEEPKNA